MSFFQQQIELNGKIIGGESVYIIAEMAIAHDGDINKAKRLIDSAYDKTKELRDKGFRVSDQLLDKISEFKISV